MLEQRPTLPAAEEVRFTSILRYLIRSKTAVGLTVLLLVLLVTELVCDGFRESFSEKYPLAVGALSSLLFITLGAIAVDLYFHERNQRHRRLEQARERAAWNPSARRIFNELREALGHPSGAVNDALNGLTRAEAGMRERNLEEIAKPLEEASKPVRAVLHQRLPLMVLRPELGEAARNAEEAAEAVDIAAGIVRSWNFDKPAYPALRETVEYLLEQEQWFLDRSRQMTTSS